MSAECRSVDVKEVQYIVKDLCIKARTDFNEDIRDAIVHAQEIEESSTGKAVLAQLIKNAEIAQSESIPICQDTGYTVIFLEVGQSIAFTGGVLYAAIEEGVIKAYTEGYLRKSIIENPITSPRNTNDNTPPIIHTEIVPGETVKIAGANPCPPILVGVGIGGTFDYVAFLAKKALLRKISQQNRDPKIAEYEIEWIREINKLGIGPAGLGGRTTALDVFIEVFPRYISSYPAAVNIQYNAARSKSYML